MTADAKTIKYVGVDGCKAGWFAVGFDDNDQFEFKLFAKFGELVKHYSADSLVLVDIPIGLPSGNEVRDCDDCARQKLGEPRRRSVFPVPTRQTVQQAARAPKDRDAAAIIEHKLAGKCINKQTFAIAPKIDEVDLVLRMKGPENPPSIREAHPELCFWALNCQQAIGPRKQTKEGRELRLRVLNETYPKSGEIYAEACEAFPRTQVERDDILDALVIAITARNGHDHLTTVPDCPPNDLKGLPMEMVYWLPH